MEGTLASYVVTMDEGAGRDELRDSPFLSFAFCYLAAHFVGDLLDETAVQGLMDVCVARRGGTKSDLVITAAHRFRKFFNSKELTMR